MGWQESSMKKNWAFIPVLFVTFGFQLWLSDHLYVSREIRIIIILFIPNMLTSFYKSLVHIPQRDSGDICKCNSGLATAICARGGTTSTEIN